eukprot:TRINITY_DN35949_c0_g1_i1.p1 TRINITY_DN35949_c0_g1~~TRINITY_DN35949_c0_g1_i1.p1  ORF type:complete len:458 (-),score=105.80 TRINITY_DN35949_c0_g1_i1:195-1568(-)
MPPKQPPADTSAAESAAKDADEEKTRLLAVTQELAKAKQLRNYYQLERDKVARFWEVAKQELERQRDVLANVHTDVQEAEEHHSADMRVYAQKIQYIAYEHSLHVAAERQRAQAAVSESVLTHRVRVADTGARRLATAQTIEDRRAEHADAVEALRHEHERLLRHRAQEGEKLLRETSDKYGKKLAVIAEELELRRKAEIHDVEERSNEHIALLVRRHEEAFLEMKQYHNRVTASNLELIVMLKSELATMRRNERYNGHLMADIQAENARLRDPLVRARKGVAELRSQLQTLGKDRQSLRLAQSRLVLLEVQHDALAKRHAALTESFESLLKKRAELLESFTPALRQVAARAQHRNRVLQKRLAAIQTAADATDAQVAEVLRVTGLPPEVLAQVSGRVSEVLAAKDRMAKDLHFELAKTAQTHCEVVKAYEAKCVGAGLPPLDLDAAGLLQTAVIPS